MKLVIDTSALVSLEIMNCFEKVIETYQVFITQEIFLELYEMADYKDVEGQAAKRSIKMIKKYKVNIEKCNLKDYKKYMTKGVDRGEASAFYICIKKGIKMFITDDVDASFTLKPLARSENIKLRICVAIVIDLVRKNIITNNVAYNNLKKLIKVRGWEGGVLEVLIERYLRK
jgi:predicted nucleic acid-binding protein